MNAHLIDIFRPEGPAGNSPERQLGVEWSLEMRPEGPAQSIIEVPRLRRSLTFDPVPGLTAGPIICRPFGPSGLDYDAQSSMTLRASTMMRNHPWHHLFSEAGIYDTA